MPDRTESDQIPRTLACARQMHQECPHFVGLGGGGFNPRRVRLEFGVGLFRCSCHSSCPLGRTSRMAVPFKLWRESCTCAGANRVRQQMAETGTEPPRFRDVR